MNSDDAVDDVERFVSGPLSAYPLPSKPLRLVGVANLKPFRCANFASVCVLFYFFVSLAFHL